MRKITITLSLVLFALVCGSSEIGHEDISVSSLQGLNKSLDKLDEVLSIKRDSVAVCNKLRTVQENK